MGAVPASRDDADGKRAAGTRVRLQRSTSRFSSQPEADTPRLSQEIWTTDNGVATFACVPLGEYFVTAGEGSTCNSRFVVVDSDTTTIELSLRE